MSRLKFSLAALMLGLLMPHPAAGQQPIVLDPSGINPRSRAPIRKPALGTGRWRAADLGGVAAGEKGPRYANVSETDGRLLRLLTETTGAKLVVEIGTSTGESGLWFALGLRKTGGRLITHEIHPGRAKIAQENFQRAGVDHLITIVLGDAHETVQNIEGPIDILFLDADKDNYLDYLDKLVPKIRPGGLIIAHNMVSPPPDPEFVKAVTQNPAFETSFLLMDAAGMSVTLKKR